MDAEFGLVESFDIDDGQLDGDSQQNCFVLGYELARISTMAELCRRELTFIVHAENRERIEKALRKRLRTWRWTWPQDDKSEDWVTLTIKRSDH